MTQKEDKLHKSVQAQYGAAISNPQNPLREATGSGKYAGYGADEVPEGLVCSSFGCGNPVAMAEVRPGQTVLDLGCGAGVDILLASQKVGPTGHVIGIDMTDAMIAQARTNIKNAGATNVEATKGFVEDLPIEENSIDLVISNCVLNMSPDKDKVFSEIYRVLKPGGRMVVADIVVQNLSPWGKRGVQAVAACAGAGISESAYLQELQKAGMEDCKVLKRQHYNASYMAQMTLDALPCWLQNRLTQRILEKVTKSLTQKIWSVSISARKS
jgi:ubiquinone/menaquinone biosynthesis C-methylase UbiE